MLRDRRSFFFGLGTGALAVVAIVSALFAAEARDGFTVHLDGEQVARMVKEQVRRQAAQDIPALLAELQRAVPAEVSRQVGEHLSSYTFRVFDVSIRLPEDAQVELNQRMTAVVLNTVEAVLQGLDAEAAAELLAEGAYRYFRTEFRQQFSRTPLMLSVWPGLQVPVTVILE